jgi:MFS family permease
MLDRLPFPLSYQIVFLISFIGGSIGMLFWAKLHIPENNTLDQNTNKLMGMKSLVNAIKESIKEPDFVRFELTIMVLRVAINLPTALYSIYWIRYLDASDLWIGWQATTSKLALIVGYFFWPKIVDRKGYRLPLLICTAGMGLYPVFTGLAPNQMWLPLISIFQGFFMTGVNLSFFDTLLSVCPSDRRPSFVAVNTTLSSLIIFLAPLLGSFLADVMHIQNVFFAAGCIHILAVILFWKYKIGVDKRESAIQ